MSRGSHTLAALAHTLGGVVARSAVGLYCSDTPGERPATDIASPRREDTGEPHDG